MTKPEVLQALSRVTLPGGGKPLAEGRVQEVQLEGEAGAQRVVVFVNDLWGEKPPAAEALAALHAAVAQLNGVARAEIRVRPAAEAPTKAARPRPSQPAPKVPAGAKLLAIASGKGGVGKSSVSANLAVALAREGLQVGLLDCDIYGFSIPALMGVEERPEALGKQFIPPRRHGVRVMSIDYFVRDNRAVVWRGPMLGKAIRQLMQETIWDEPDVIVLDLPPGTGDVALDVHQFFPDARVAIVTTPDPIAARVAIRAGTMAIETEHEVVGVIENMSYLPCGECGAKTYPLGRGGGELVAAQLDAPLLARIPFESRSEPTADGLMPEKSEAGRIYVDLARRLHTHHLAAAPQGSTLSSATGSR